MNLRFHHIEDDDVETVVGLMREYYAYDNLAYDENVARSGVMTLLRDQDLGRIWLLLDGDRVLGYVVLAFSFSLEFHGVKGFVDELYIREEFRGKGIGGRTLEFLAEVSRSLGISALRLEVEHGNHAALKLYKRMGFDIHDRHLMTKWL